MLRFLTAGESHGPEILVVVEGMPAGVPIRPDALDRDLGRRQLGYGRGARSTRIERDRGTVVGGVARGRTTGAPVAVRIVNRDFANQPADPAPITTPRPGHADLAGSIKYGLGDFRLVRERASARETAARVAAGALAKELLSAFAAQVGSFVDSIGDVAAPVDDGPVDELAEDSLLELAARAEEDPVRCPHPGASERMRAAIDEAKEMGETLGGSFWVFAAGMPPGLGSYAQWDRRLDGRLAQAICSIPAIKGVAIGDAFRLSALRGSEAQDPIVRRDGEVTRASNRAGGLEAGVSNGRPILLHAAMKPLSSIRAEIASIDFGTGDPADPPYVRSDVCAVPAAAVVGEAMTAWILADALVERLGADRLDAMLAAARAMEPPTPPAGR